MSRPSCVSDQAEEIIEALKNLLGVAVALSDEQRQMVHVAMPTMWFSCQESETDDPYFQGCNVAARINDRWKLTVGSGRNRRMHHDAKSLVKWAAAKLAVHLPVHKGDADEATPSPARGGGSGGSAEIGIPVSGARKRRN
jgi:hypothetical protein